jgi:hypothetical protein
MEFLRKRKDTYYMNEEQTHIPTKVDYKMPNPFIIFGGQEALEQMNKTLKQNNK